MTTNGTKPRATILSLEIHDFQGLRAAKLEHIPGSGLVRVTGRNGAGKSSILRAIEGALGGRARVHERAVNDDAEDGKASVDLELTNGFRVTKRHTEANPKGYLTVLGPDGGKHGQGRLDEMVGPLSFDPLAFYGLKPERQREILLSLGRDPDLAKKLDEVRSEREQLVEERRPFNSDKQRIERMVQPDGSRPDPIDVTAATRRLQELQTMQRQRSEAETAVANAETMVTQAQNSVSTAEGRIRDLERQLVEARADRDDKVRAREEAKAVLRNAQSILERHEDPSVEITAVMGRISQADQVSEALEPWKAWERDQAKLAEVKAQAEVLTMRIDSLKERERELIAEAGIPVDGLTFDESGEPLLNGRPLVLASGGERIRMSVRVALAVDPELGVCLVDEANDLDIEALEELDRLAIEHGFQVWACRLGLEGPGDVVVQDGLARGRDADGVQGEAPAPAPVEF